MTNLLIGGAGYIGSVIAELLVEEGQQAVVYDNLSQGHRQAVPQGAQLVVGDLADQDKLLHTLQNYGVDAVIHLAARSLVGESYADPQSYYWENVAASLILLQAMREAGVSKIVFSSTAAVYGEPREIPITEEHPELPTNPYGETKLTFERALRWYKEAYGLQYCSLRYFNAAGATRERGEDHRPETHLIPLTLSVALGHRDYLEIYGDDYDTPDGTCLRDYIHVMDLAQAHLLALERLVDTKTSPIYNLGNERGYSVREVIKVTQEVTGRYIPTRIASRRKGDPSVLVASSEKIKRKLGWRPQHQDIYEIVESAWQWHRRHPQGYEEGK